MKRMETAAVPSVRVNRKGADRLTSGHPWVFTGDVLDRGEATPGAVVQVIDTRGRALGMAHHSASSQIALRLLSRRIEPIDESFYRRRLAAAIEFRAATVRDADAYRVVFGEGDLLPGLIVDRYGPALVIQLLDQGMEGARSVLLPLLDELLQPTAIVARHDVAVRSKEQLSHEIAVLSGELAGPVPVHLNGLEFRADLLHGQKTGIYLDQRENYAAAARHARGRALDCFTSTGGFALHLASRGSRVTAIDSSADALAAAGANAAANGITDIEFREADVFDYLAAQTAAHERFDTVVLDPPAFTKNRAGQEGALRGYREINQRALRLLGPGGILITCSCSHHISEAMLLGVIAEAALDTGRTLRVRERRTQASDHPILLTVPETLYLKCLILEVV